VPALREGPGLESRRLWSSVSSTAPGLDRDAAGVAFSRDGRRLAWIDWGGTVRLVADWQAFVDAAMADRPGLVQSLTAHRGGVTALAFAGPSLYTAGGDGLVCRWNLPEQGKPLPDKPARIFREHESPVRALAVHAAAGTTWIASADDRTTLISLRVAGAGVSSHRSLVGHTGVVRCLAFSGDGRRLVSGSDDRTVRLWDVPTGALMATLRGHTARVNAVVFLAGDRYVVSGSDDRTAQVWDLGRQTGPTLLAHRGRIDQLAFQGKDHLLVLAAGEVHRRDLRSTTVVPDPPVLEDVSAVALAPSGRWLAASLVKGNAVVLIDPADLKRKRRLEGHPGRVRDLAFSADERFLASASDDGTVHVWEVRTGRLRHTLRGHTGHVYAVLFMPDDKRLVSAGQDRTIRVWRLGSAVKPRILRGHKDAVTALACWGSQLASASQDMTVRLWELDGSRQLQVMHGHTGWVLDLAFSPDGRRLVSAAGDGAVFLWDAQTGQVVLRLRETDRPVRAVAFSADGKRLAAGDEDGTVRIYQRGGVE
jgi:WD40 repeat protein